MVSDGSKRPEASQGQPSQPAEGSVDQSTQPDQASTGEPTQAQTPSLPTLVVPNVLALPCLASPTLARERWLQEDKRITKFRWENVKILKGKNLHDAKKYLANRDGKICTECGLESQDEQSFDAHHNDGNRENNKRWNLRLTDHPCNSRLNGNLRANQIRERMSSLVHPAASARENDVAVPSGAVGLGDEVVEDAIADGVTPVPVGTRPWSSREGEKSERMRSSFNTWIRDSVNGPFASLDGEAPAISLAALGRIAVHAIGFGSSQTYERYCLEDSYGKKLGEPGILEVFFDEKGRKMVRFRGPKMLSSMENKEQQQKIDA